MQPAKQPTTLPPPVSSAPMTSESEKENNPKKPLSPGNRNRLTETHIGRLWERMAKIYGHRWVSSYGELDDGSWLSGLADVTPEQIGVGLEKLRISASAWPPSLPEFRAMCLPPIVPPYHVPFVRPETEMRRGISPRVRQGLTERLRQIGLDRGDRETDADYALRCRWYLFQHNSVTAKNIFPEDVAAKIQTENEREAKAERDAIQAAG